MRSWFITVFSGSWRRAFLCGVDPLSGNSYDHRRTWIRDRLESLAGLYGVEIVAFAVMSNQLHVILRNRPMWSPSGPIRRLLGGGWPSFRAAWKSSRILPPPSPRPSFLGATAEQAQPALAWHSSTATRGQPTDPLEQAVGDEPSADPAPMAMIRGRLSSLSWFMRALAEPIARRANREDHCTGRFFEGRFKSQRLLDEAALLGVQRLRSRPQPDPAPGSPTGRRQASWPPPTSGSWPFSGTSEPNPIVPRLTPIPWRRRRRTP